MKQICARLRTLRKERKWSQSELGAQLGISQSAYSQIENDFVSLSIDHLERLSELYAVSMDWLVRGRGLRSSLETDHSFMPLVREGARAGYLSQMHNIVDCEGSELIKLPDMPEGNHCAFEVGTDSMRPTIQPKDRMICAKVEDLSLLRKDQVLLMIDDKGFSLGRLSRFVDGDALHLSFDNFDFPDIIRPTSEIGELWLAIGRITNNLSKENSDYMDRVTKLEKQFEQVKWQLDQVNKGES